jgi:hypothetical protein
VADLFQSVQKLQKRLGEKGIPSAIIGGLAVAIWGEPRLTRDIDLKVALQRDQATRLVSLLTPDYVPLSTEPEQTLRRMGILFIQDAVGVRLDLLLADTPFDTQVIQRARQVEVQPELDLIVCTPEDLILYKMISTRPRDRDDVHGVVRRQADALDDAYLLGWLEQFEQALDDSTLVAEYQKIRGISGVV